MAAPSLLTLVDVFHEVAVLLGVSPNDLILLVNDNAHLLQTFCLELIKVSFACLEHTCEHEWTRLQTENTRERDGQAPPISAVIPRCNSYVEG